MRFALSLTAYLAICAAVMWIIGGTQIGIIYSIAVALIGVGLWKEAI